MKTYICTEVVTYKATNRKAEEVALFASGLKHRLIKGSKPVQDLIKAIKDHCRMLDRKFAKSKSRVLDVQSYSGVPGHVQITIYSGDPTNMNSQPKAAVIYLAELAGEINMDKCESGTINFDPEEGGQS
jgi:hypothetical protein